MRHGLQLFFLTLLAASCTSKPNKLESAASAVASSPTEKGLLANVKLMEADRGVKIHVQATGLKPGSVHGLHIHEFGKCEGDFTSAGGHFNPAAGPHSSPEAKHKQLGDQGNVKADSQGEGMVEVFIPEGDVSGVDTFLNKSVVLHADPDDFVTQPSGNSGKRIACGVIKKTVVEN